MKINSVVFRGISLRLSGVTFKHSGFTLALALLIGVLSVVPAKGLQITMAPGFGPYDIGSGGEFTVTPDAALAPLIGTYSPFTMNYVAQGSFQTFCLERNEFIAPSLTYDVTLNNVTLFTGIPLTVGAAYLYEQFATGALNYNYADAPGGSRTANGFHNAYYLQLALWHYMGQYSSVPANPYETLVNGLFGAGAFAPDNGAHHVMVMNLWAPGQHDAAHAYQDLLVYMPVPEPSALALITVALTAFVASRKRK
jgi:hypothetical protein